ncbi:CU044_5270 family protein [Kribbella swartbergensis]
MNDIDLLRRLRPQVAEPDPVVLARARLAMRAPQSPRRPAVRRTFAAAALAATLTTGILVSDVMPRGGSPSAVADARTFLTAVAERTATNPDEPIPAGGYRVVRTRTSTMGLVGPDDHQVRVRSVGQVEWWVPSAERPPYTAVIAWNLQREYLDKADEEWARENYPKAFETFRRVVPSACAVLDSGSAMVPADPKAGCKVDWHIPSAEFLSGLSRDPAKLLNQLTTAGIVGPDPAETAFERLAAVLSSGIAPRDLRVALYQAARDIPGVTLVDGAVTLDGTTGHAISLEKDGVRTELIIDPTTGRFLGRRQVLTNPTTAKPSTSRLPDLPAGTVLTWTSVTIRTTTTPPPSR